jgi:hypothetical protein
MSNISCIFVQDNISHYISETNTFISVKDYERLSTDQKSKVKPVFKNNNPDGRRYKK